MSKAAAVDLGPVVKTIDVRRSAADAFRIFTEEVDAWWPKDSHTRMDVTRRTAGTVSERTTRSAPDPVPDVTRARGSGPRIPAPRSW